MKVIYRGHEIEAYRARSMGGETLLYYSVFRVSDGRECVCDFTTGSETPREYVQIMKERIDAELAEDDPWMEKALYV